MQIQSDFPLVSLNTFGLESSARYYVEVQSEEELTVLLRDNQWKDFPKFILGGGSNVLFTKNIDALVIRPNIKGIETVSEDQEKVTLKVGAGEAWHDLVLHCVKLGLGGIENLSLIPGSVGAAPMQNIGAYGVEVKDVITLVKAMEIATGNAREFSKEECAFGYRESIFKKELKDRYIITEVHFELSKNPTLHIDYGDVRKTLADMNVEKPGIKEVSDAIIQIRRSKLPDPAQIGNAGSFFKNPEIPAGQYEQLKMTYPEMPGYQVDQQLVKVPAGWLIEKAGWKGYKQGNIGVHEKQALVLVNYGGGTGHEIKALSETIQSSIEEKFGISLKAEVNFI
jgi:UDP-N-acetylmuramate dehydrogenase